MTTTTVKRNGAPGLTRMAKFVSFGVRESTEKCDQCAKNNNAFIYNRAFAVLTARALITPLDTIPQALIIRP